jgi:hypothetical protein
MLMALSYSPSFAMPGAGNSANSCHAVVSA